jgi:hypothetical protein
VEAYDTLTDRWTTVADMLQGRSDLAAAVIGGKILALGGQENTRGPHV